MNTKKLRILVADDNKDFCDCLCNYLEKQSDMEVVCVAYDGIEAYNKILAENPDIALIDGIMPKLDGIGILEKLANCGKNVDTMCIMLTAITGEQITQKALYT